MDSTTSQTSADDIKFSRSCSCSNLSDISFSDANGCCGKEIVDKLVIQLKEKDEQLEKSKQAIVALQMTLMKSFPSSHLCYYIKVASELPNQFNFLYAHSSGQLHSSGDLPFPCAGHFKFTKNSDSSYSIYSVSKQKHLEHFEPNDYPYLPMTNFSANDCSTINTKFELFFHQQQNQPCGMLVDIRSLAKDCFIHECKDNYFLADSTTVPANKFLIIPVVDGQ